MKRISSTPSGTTKQLFSLNLIRAVAIIMVLLHHSLRDDLSVDLKYLLDLVLDADALLFFMISGALLMPVKGSWSEFIRRRVTKVFVPFVIWTLIYAVSYYSDGWINDYTLAMQIRWSWLSFNFWPGWFIPTLMSLYLIMPILSPWIATATRKQFHYVLILWLLSSVLPYLQPIAGFDLRYTPLTLMLNAVPYAIIGYYLTCYRNRQPLLPSYVVQEPVEGLTMSEARRKTRRIRLVVMYAMMIVAGVVLPFVLRDAFEQVDVRSISHEWTATPGVVLSIFYFSLLVRVKTLGTVVDKVVNFVSRHSFGIYLSHSLFLTVLFPRYVPEIMDSTILLFIMVFASSLALTYLLRKIPFLGRYLG